MHPPTPFPFIPLVSSALITVGGALSASWLRPRPFGDSEPGLPGEGVDSLPRLSDPSSGSSLPRSTCTDNLIYFLVILPPFYQHYRAMILPTEGD